MAVVIFEQQQGPQLFLFQFFDTDTHGMSEQKFAARISSAPEVAQFSFITEEFRKFTKKYFNEGLKNHKKETSVCWHSAFLSDTVRIDPLQRILRVINIFTQKA